MEHRLGHRIDADEVVRLRTLGKEKGTAILANLSVSGAFLRTHSRLATFTLVDVILASRRGERRRNIAVRAQVVRSCPFGLGIEWLEFAPAEIRVRLSEQGSVWPVRESLAQASKP